jgi:hypothetical protein
MWMLSILACQDGGTGVSADYELALTPIFPQNQEPLDLAQTIRLTLVQDGEEVGEGRIDTVPASGESASVGQMPALDNTEIYVDALGPSEVLAWGKTRPLTAETGEVEAPVYIAKAETFGHLGGLASALADTTPIAAGAGRFYAAGGSTLSSSGKAIRGDNGLYLLDIPNSDALPTFARIGDLPAWSDDDTQSDRVGATFLAIKEPGTGTPYGILIGGGSSPVEGGSGAADTTYSVNLYNLETGVWDESPLENKYQLQNPRQSHVAAVDYRGQVVVAGGWQSAGSGWYAIQDVEMYVPNERKFYTVDQLPTDVGSFGLGIASLGEKGTLLCGGGILDNDGVSWDATTGCVRVATSRELATDVKEDRKSVV